MEPKFIRIFRNEREILINIGAIAEIEVEYVVKGEGAQEKTGFSIGYGAARENPNAMRVYHVTVGNSKHTLVANPGSPVMQILDEIYKNAIKAD